MNVLLPLFASLTALVATGPSPRAFIQQRVAQRLDLSADQQARIQLVMKAHRPSLRSKADTLKQARRATVDGLLDAAVTDEQLRQAQGSASAASLDLLLEAHQIAREIDPILTPEQKAKAKGTLLEFRTHLDGLRALAMNP